MVQCVNAGDILKAQLSDSKKTTGKGNQLPSLDRISKILSKGEPMEDIDIALISSSDEASSSESDWSDEE